MTNQLFRTEINTKLQAMITMYGMNAQVVIRQLLLLSQNPARFTRQMQEHLGDEHQLALLVNGEVVVWGSNQEGQLGLGDGNQGLFVQQPTQLPLIKDEGITVKQVFAGSRSSV
eukprot:TRINITY_DN27910_c0_g1_i2.p1 TRINITY_DN27910_c0_g1~~TRINITY_DN27910_c0_g1_i2.p1  ORF type:complete len:130 (-),score=11.16 TRINITY_DN27910_c0_g1_i2:73-414(-)